MLNQILNSRTILVFIIPFFLGLLSVLSFQPFNITLINFLIIPIFFLILSNINKRSKNKYRNKPYLKNPHSFIDKKIELLNKKNKLYKKNTLICSLLLSGAKEIKKLNKKFRKKK